MHAMISRSLQHQGMMMMQMFPPPGTEDLVSQSVEIVNNYNSTAVGSSSSSSAGGSSSHSSSILFNLSVLRDKLNQVQTLVGVILSPDQNLQQNSTTSIAVSSMNCTIQEIIVTATSMMFTCQQIALTFPPPPPGTIATTTLAPCANNNNQLVKNNNNDDDDDPSVEISDNKEGVIVSSPKSFDIIELDAGDLLAKYTHYCSVCGKGFKRDANLRMHMRAHGDEYKTSAALSNPLKKHNNKHGNNGGGDCLVKYYSCPQEGCRWNQKHPKFQPLKSMICAKNHYKRSQLSKDCSCGTTFSRKDKLVGHVALFVGHRALPIAFDQYTA
ncbi:hypothetical protein PIB30_066770 [Stylosanthes scabra]|uniref:C2H2-type domain-containing protein n=1 Tax=Stylosanthes scabra TaxID=79078 RepID=A0ABU6ZL70_9FABA|nr:hypothetical protein [Stylosanthes scabra]